MTAALFGLALLPAAVRGQAAVTQPSGTLPSGTQPSAPRWPQPGPPSPAEIAQGEELVRRAFQEAFEPPTTATATGNGAVHRKRQGAFARRLLFLGLASDNDPGERFALFSEARDLAASAGDADVAMQAIGRLAALFNVDAEKARESALAAVRTASEAADLPEQRASNRQVTLLLIEASLAAGDYDLAERAMEIARNDPGRFDDPAFSALLETMSDPNSILAGTSTESNAASAAAQKLHSDPENRESLESLGVFLCVNRGDWRDGVPMLAKAASGQSAAPQALLSAAREEAAAGAAPRDRNTAVQLAARLGHSWWSAADHLQGRARLAARQRSVQWYLREMPRLKDVALAAAQAHATAFQRSIVQSGLLADLHLGDHFQRRVLTRVDPLLDFNWDNVSPDPRLPLEHYSICWQGFIKSPTLGTYRLVAKADDGIIVNVDGRALIDQWHSPHGDYRATIEMTGELQPVYVLYYQETGPAHLQLQWVGPGDDNAVTIPASAFFHEPVWPWGQVAAVVGARPADAQASTGADGSVAWFARFPQALPWHVAERACQRVGGHLAWSRRPEDADVLNKLAAGAHAWLGATDEPVEGRWEWTDGLRVDPKLFNWREGEPNGGIKENFLELKDGAWNDADGHAPFICQWDR